MAGRKSNVEDYYNMFDVFLLPSFYEGFPVSLIEAQCAGLHSIVSNTVSNESMITEEVVSLSIEDPNQWVLEILNDQNSDRNFNDQLQMFDIQYLAKDLENYYSSLLEKYN